MRKICDVCREEWQERRLAAAKGAGSGRLPLTHRAAPVKAFLCLCTLGVGTDDL